MHVSLIQQCKMLEYIIGVSLVNQCLHSPDDALHLISTGKADILRGQDECNLMPVERKCRQLPSKPGCSNC